MTGVDTAVETEPESLHEHNFICEPFKRIFCRGLLSLVNIFGDSFFVIALFFNRLYFINNGCRLRFGDFSWLDLLWLYLGSRLILIYYDYFSFRLCNWLRLRCHDDRFRLWCHNYRLRYWCHDYRLRLWYHDGRLRLWCHDNLCRLGWCDNDFDNIRLNFNWGILRAIFWIFSPLPGLDLAGSDKRNNKLLHFNS